MADERDAEDRLRLTEAGLNCGTLLLMSDTCMMATPSLVKPIPPISAICSLSRKLFTTWHKAHGILVQ